MDTTRPGQAQIRMHNGKQVTELEPEERSGSDAVTLAVETEPALPWRPMSAPESYRQQNHERYTTQARCVRHDQETNEDCGTYIE